MRALTRNADLDDLDECRRLPWGRRFRFAVPAGHVSNRTRAGDELDGDNKQSEERETTRKATRTLAIALLLAGSAALTAAAQTSRGASDINSAAQNFYADRTSRLPGMGAALPAGIHSGLRPVPMLVPPLLVTHTHATRAVSRRPSSLRLLPRCYILHSCGESRRAVRA